MSAVREVTVAMGEETTVYLEDMELFLTPEEYQAFLKARTEVEEYEAKKAEYDNKKAEADRLRDECRRKRDEAKTGDERRFWDAEERKHMMGASTLSPPYYSVYYFGEYDRYVGLVRERKERRQKRSEALKSIHPPVDDARKYLSNQEYQQFLNSFPGAADAFLESKARGSYHPRAWLLNKKAFVYSLWTSIIEERAEEETRQKQAQIEYDQYLDRLSATVEKFKGELAKGKKPKFHYLLELEKYQPDGWCDLELPSKQQIQNWAERKVVERLPEILANLTKWEVTWEVRVLPNATYEADTGVPCLTWYFESHILVTVNLELKKGKIRKRRPGYTVEVQAEGKKLGTIYFGPARWVTAGSLTTPIPLLCLLAKGELEAPGVTVTDRSPPFMTFVIQGLEKEVEVCDDFRRFIEDIAKETPLAQALLDKGLIDEDTAKLVEAKVKLPLPQPVGAQPSAVQGTSDNNDVIAALQSLGYKGAEAKEIVGAAQLSPGMSLEEKVEAVLKNMGG